MLEGYSVSKRLLTHLIIAREFGGFAGYYRPCNEVRVEKVDEREIIALQMTFQRYAPDAVRVCTHIARIQISRKVHWLKVNSFKVK